MTKVLFTNTITGLILQNGIVSQETEFREQ